MRKAIFVKFIQVLLAALMLNSVVFYIVTSSVMFQNSRKDMLYTLETIDSVLNYSEDLNLEVEKLSKVTEANDSRFTIIDKDGMVAADTGVMDPSALDNHLEREEVIGAIQEGDGYSRRYSKTLNKTMLYAAIRSQHSDHILRLSLPFSGLTEYTMMLLPAVWLSFVIALLVTAAVADRFSSSITKPLHEISKEMSKGNGNYGDLSFENTKYPEINIIAETTSKMSYDVKEYVNQIDLERQIRQEFFTNASHELKTPITSIQGYAELLESGMIQNEESRQDFLRRIKKESMNMTNLINDILMISRLETKEAEVVMGDVRISLVLQDIMDSLKPLAARQEVMVHIDCKPLCIYANAQQMRELCGNLISNALKYNRPGGQVWIRVTDEEHNLVIHVRDNGVGIGEESIPRIFERFYRVDKGRNKKQGGTGLGLAIVKHIVNFYHGTIQVTSKLDSGTEFIVKLPMQ